MITKIEAGEEVRGEIPYYCNWEEKYCITIKLNPETKELVFFNCTCPFGSFYGKSKKNKGKEICRHVIHAYGVAIDVSPIKARELSIKQGIMSEDHLQRM